MKEFEFYFDGKPRDSDNSVNAGLKKLSGNPLDIGLCLGTYASEALKQLKEPHCAIIVLNAFKKFMELNPDITEQVMQGLLFNDGARIVKPPIDAMGNANLLKAIKKN